MVKSLMKFFAILVLTYSSAFAQWISVSASTDTSIYKVGDYIKYELEIRHDRYIVVYLPSIKDSIKALEFIQLLPSEKSEVESKIIERHYFIFSGYDSAQVTIPSIAIPYTVGESAVKKFISTNTFAIKIQTLPVNPQEDIRDVKEPMKLPLNLLLIIAIVVIVLLLIGLVYYLYQRYFKKKSVNVDIIPEIKIPAFEIALQELNKLEGKKLWQHGKIKEYHSEITEIIRKYFEERFNFLALELTSSEIMACLSYLEEAKIIVNTTDDFLSNADLVKFAKFQPMPSVNEEMMRQAYQIVTDTISKPEPVEIQEVQNA